MSDWLNAILGCITGLGLITSCIFSYRLGRKSVEEDRHFADYYWHGYRDGTDRPRCLCTHMTLTTPVRKIPPYALDIKTQIEEEIERVAFDAEGVFATSKN